MEKLDRERELSLKHIREYGLQQATKLHFSSDEQIYVEMRSRESLEADHILMSNTKYFGRYLSLFIAVEIGQEGCNKRC